MTDTTSTRPQMGDEDLDPFEKWFASMTRAEQQERLQHSYHMRMAWNAARASLPQPTAGSTGAEEDVQYWLCRVYGLRLDRARADAKELMNIIAASTPAQSGLEDALNPSHRRWTERKFRNAHTIDIIVRKDAQEYRYEGDFLKDVARIIAPEISE
jgi:hypothetical protein